MKVRISTPARSDIRSIFEFLKSQAGIRKAREIVAEIRERCIGLERMPERYTTLEGFQSIRRRVYRDYLIIYRIHPERVEILRIFHGASDYLQMLEDDKRLNS